MIFMNNLKAGFARVNITPSMGIPISGYFKERFAEGVLDDLEMHLHWNAIVQKLCLYVLTLAG